MKYVAKCFKQQKNSLFVDVSVNSNLTYKKSL